MAAPPPPPGLDLSESQVPRILGVNIATFVVAVLAICLRFIARRVTRQPLWWDDWLMLPAIAAAFTMMIVSITYMVEHGLGRHVWVGPPDAAIAWAKGLFISEVSYTCIICSVKFSLLAFYWRIFKQSRIRVPIYILTAVVSAWGIAVMLVTILQCQPVEAFWTRFAPTTSPNSFACRVNVNQFFNGNSIPNIITDAALLVLPLPFIWGLQLPTAQKLALSSIFVLGIFVVSVSIARFTFILNLDLQSPDITWNFVNVQIWTGVESHIGIACACLPSLRPILNLMLFGSVNRSHWSSKGSSAPSGKLAGRYSWEPHHLRSKFGGRLGSTTVAEESEQGFVRLEERTNNQQHKPSHSKADSGIHVRTDLFVSGQNKEDRQQERSWGPSF